MGLRRSVVGMATIMGPLWAGAAIPWPYVMFGVMTGLLLMSLVSNNSHTEGITTVFIWL